MALPSSKIIFIKAYLERFRDVYVGKLTQIFQRGNKKAKKQRDRGARYTFKGRYD